MAAIGGGQAAGRSEMMKITNLELIAPKGPRLPIVANPAFTPGTPMERYSGGVIVKVSTDEGITGVGAVTPGPGSVATYGTATADEVEAFGFKWGRTGRSSKHMAFDWSGPG